MTTMLALAIPNAEPLPLPAPAWLLWSLMLLTFFLHLLAMNGVLGGSVIAAVASTRRASSENHRRLGAAMGKLMPTLVAAAITFGVAPLLFLQALYGRLLFTSSILMAWFWLAVIPILILAYYGTYLIAFRGERLGRAASWLPFAVAVLFLSIAFLYVNNMSLVLRPSAFLRMFGENAGGTHLNLGDPTFLPRYLHMVLGAIAVAGLAIAGYGAIVKRRDEAWGGWVTRHGALWFAAATALNVLVGFWWLAVLPRQVMLRFMGENAAATVWMAAGITLGLAALVLAVALIAGRQRSIAITAAWAALAGSMIAMVLVRDEVRRATLEPSGFTLPSWTEPQWGVIAIFAVLLVAAFAVTIWMALLLFRPEPGAGTPREEHAVSHVATS